MEIIEWCRLGLKQGFPAREDQPVTTRPAAGETSVCKSRILIAEDNATNQKVAVGILKKLGYQSRHGGQRPGGYPAT